MFNPEDGPARVFRWVTHMPVANQLTMYYERENHLMIDKELFERLDDTQRHRVLRSEEQVLMVTFPPNKPPVVTSRGNDDDE